MEEYLSLMEGADDQLVEVLKLFAELKGGTMRAGSICTGLGTFEMVLQRFLHAWSLRHPDVPLQACFWSCPLMQQDHFPHANNPPKLLMLGGEQCLYGGDRAGEAQISQAVQS